MQWNSKNAFNNPLLPHRGRARAYQPLEPARKAVENQNLLRRATALPADPIKLQEVMITAGFTRENPACKAANFPYQKAPATERAAGAEKWRCAPAERPGTGGL